MKKAFSALTMLLVLAMLLAACGGGGSPGSTPAGSTAPAGSAASTGGGDDTLSAPGEWPITTEPVTLTIFNVLAADVEDLSTNLYTQEVEELTGVHIEWQTAPLANLVEKRNLVLASGSYPDAFMNCRFTNTELLVYANQGILVPLNNLIDTQMVYFQDYLPTREGLRDALTAPDGNIYSLGNDQLCFHCHVNNKMWINEEWLDNLELEMPQTTEDFYNVLTAFKNDDPNGNGTADEIPLVTMAPNVDANHLTTFIMNAFIYDDGKDHLLVNNGTVEVAYNTEEWREGLRYFKQLYDDGLLDPTSFTMTQEQVKTLAEKDDDAIIGAFSQLHPGAYMNLSTDKYLQYGAVPPLEGPEGNRTCAWNYYNGSYNIFTITSACENPEIAARWADHIYIDDEQSIRARLGVKGEQWGDADPGEKGLHGDQATWKKLTPLGTQTQNVYWGDQFTATFDHSNQTGGANDYEYMLYDNALKYEPYKPDVAMVMPRIWLNESEVDQNTQYTGDLKSYVDECFAKFVTGNMSIENDWESYLNELKVIGLEEYLAIQQKAYDALQ